MLYGPKSDRFSRKNAQEANQPGLFDEDFKTLLGEKMQQIGKTVDEIEKETEKREAKAKKKPSRPSEHRYSRLEERHKVLYPEGINLEDFEEMAESS